MSGSSPNFIHSASGDLVIGDWRPGFLKAGAPLVFVITFKLLDMLVEWILEANECSPTFRFTAKLKHLNDPLVYPEPFQAKEWLWSRVLGLYRRMEPLRGTIIHDKHFDTSNGTVNFSGSRKRAVGGKVEIGPELLRTLALTVISILRYIDGGWKLNEYHEKVLQYNLDNLTDIHHLPPLGQLLPYYPTVRVFVAASDSLTVNLEQIHNDLSSHYPNNDCMFDLRVVIVREGIAVDAFLFPWSLIRKADQKWSLRSPKQYRVAIPEDIDKKYLKER